MKHVLALAALALAVAGPALADGATITIENFTFNPPLLTIKAGTVVTWVNGDDIPHSVVENNRAFHSPPLDTGEKFSMAFTKSGETGYFCGFHAHMQGKVIVTP